MNAALDASESHDVKARETFAREAYGYIELLRQHIEKENTILFALGEKILSPEMLKGLYTRF
ncbi:MAG: hypothetical protein CVV27_13985 [Candidatus Melainabacteria bacterium HGW-Melainabacteria-1]|nr:MAG: hypothetical protein CVV27_13985 [Candidatus Melainabacteria bacterium HGW-Melainabacteria-1]